MTEAEKAANAWFSARHDRADRETLCDLGDTMMEELELIKRQKDELLRICKLMRDVLVSEHDGVPRYTVTAGAALNCFMEEELLPAIRNAEYN